jgi:hypothetical protein
MGRLPDYLREMLKNPDPLHWYLFPNSKRRRSRMHQLKIDNGVLLEPRHRRLIETMEREREADILVGRFPDYPGLRSDEQWAAIMRCKKSTIAHYRRKIDSLFSAIGVNAETSIFETIEREDFVGTRLREMVTVVPPPIRLLSPLEGSLPEVVLASTCTPQ